MTKLARETHLENLSLGTSASTLAEMIPRSSATKIYTIFVKERAKSAWCVMFRSKELTLNPCSVFSNIFYSCSCLLMIEIGPESESAENWVGSV